MDSLTQSTTRLAVIMGLVTILIGAMTFIPHWLPDSVTTQPINVTAAPQPAHSVTGDDIAIDPLPTIPPSTVRPLPTIGDTSTVTQRAQPFTISSAVRQQAGGAEQAPTDVATRLVWHLGCLQPAARHDLALDGLALERALRETALLPEQGAIQIVGGDAQRILLGPDQAALLEAASERCGETLIFGVPPLDWLHSGVHFGIGVDRRPEGVVIIVITQ